MGGGVGGQGGIGGQGGTGWQGEHTQGRRSGWALMRFMAHSPLEYPPRGGIQYSDTRHSPFQSIWQSGCRAVFSASYPMSSPRPRARPAERPASQMGGGAFLYIVYIIGNRPSGAPYGSLSHIECCKTRGQDCAVQFCPRRFSNGAGRFATGCDVWSPSNFIAKIPKALCSAGKRFTFF